MPSVSKLPLTFLLICFVIQSYGPQSVIVIVVFQALNLILVAFTTSKWRWHRLTISLQSSSREKGYEN